MFQQAGDSITWIQTKLVTYLVTTVADITNQHNAQPMARCKDAEQHRQKDFKMRPVHESCQNNDVSWKVSDSEISRAIDIVAIKFFGFNCIHSVIVTRIKTRSSQQPQCWNAK